MESDDDAPLLTRASESGDALQPGEFNSLLARWATNDSDSEQNGGEGDQVEPMWNNRRASSVKSGVSQEPPLQCSDSLSQVLEPSLELSESLSQGSELVEERQKLSRADALNLLREASSAAEAAQKALEKVSGEDFRDASQEELSVRDVLISKIKRKLNRLQEEAKKRKWNLANMDDTFLSTSTYDEIGQLKRGRDEKVLENPNEKATQTESLVMLSRGVQTGVGQTENPQKTFKKSFDQLKDKGVKSYFQTKFDN